MMDFMQNVLGFIVITVFLKIIVAHWLAERFVGFGRSEMAKNPRVDAIVSHFILGHPGNKADSVLTCGQGKCSVFN